MSNTMSSSSTTEKSASATASATAAAGSSSSSMTMTMTTIRQFLSWSTWSDIFERLPTSMQFSILVVCVVVFFGLHNLLQEAIMGEMKDHQYGIMLGYTEVLGVAICSFIERHYIVRERDRVAPYSAFFTLTFCLLASSALSNISLNYINFPTKVVFRSSKLIPTMLIASFMHHKVFSSVEYACAMSVCTGLVLFAAADWTLTPSFHPIGLLLVTASVVADAFLPNAQERLFRLGSSRLEVTLFTNVFTLAVYTCSTLISGDLVGSLKLCRTNSQLTLYFTIYTFVAYIAISFHMTVVKRFGGVAAVVVATGRKGLTLVLSFLLFPKAFSWYYPAGATLVLGGILVASLVKIKNKKKMTHAKNSSMNLQDVHHHHHHQNGGTTSDSLSSAEAALPFLQDIAKVSQGSSSAGYRGTMSSRRGIKSHLSDIETPPASSAP